MPNFAKLEIGDFVLDPSRNHLVGTAGSITLEPKVVDVLLALAAQPGVVISRDELIDAVWKTEFGADERITRAISLLRKAFADERGAAKYIETIPKRGYRLIVPVRPFVGCEPFAAASTSGERTLGQQPIAAEPAAALPVALPVRRWWSYSVAACIAAIGLAAIAAFAWPWRSEAPAGHDVVRLAPLTMIDVNGAVFARQVHASLKRVMATTSVDLVDVTGRPEEQAAGEFSLSGSVEQVGDQVAVNLYFNNTADGQTLWSRRFQRGVADAENLREETSANTAFMIECALTARRAAREKPSREAFKLYLESCDPGEVWANPTRKRVVAQRLIAVAPRDAYGHWLEALATAQLASSDDVSESERELLTVAAVAARRRAVELDPTSPLGGFAELLLRPQTEHWRNIDVLRRASDAHASACGLYFSALRSMGRIKEALYTTSRAAAQTVLRPHPRTWQATIRMQMGEHEEAERLFDRVLRIWPDDEKARFYQFINTAFYGDPARARSMMSDHLNPQGQRCYSTFLTLRSKAGATREDLAALRLACVPESESQRDYFARMQVALGDVDGAYEVLRDKNFVQRNATVFLFYPEMAAFRRDARFMPFIAKSGLLEAWLETDRWPDFCEDKNLPYDCKAAARRAIKEAAGQPETRSDIR